MLKVGDAAPDIDGHTDSGQDFRLSEMRGKRVVLYFYPRAGTPGCTVEACEFRGAIQAFGVKGHTDKGAPPTTWRAPRNSQASTVQPGAIQAFGGKGATVIGVSPDKPAA